MYKLDTFDLGQTSICEFFPFAPLQFGFHFVLIAQNCDVSRNFNEERESGEGKG